MWPSRVALYSSSTCGGGSARFRHTKAGLRRTLDQLPISNSCCTPRCSSAPTACSRLKHLLHTTAAALPTSSSSSSSCQRTSDCSSQRSSATRGCSGSSSSRRREGRAPGQPPPTALRPSSGAQPPRFHPYPALPCPEVEHLYSLLPPAYRSPAQLNTHRQLRVQPVGVAVLALAGAHVQAAVRRGAVKLAHAARERGREGRRVAGAAPHTRCNNIKTVQP